MMKSLDSERFGQFDKLVISSFDKYITHRTWDISHLTSVEAVIHSRLLKPADYILEPNRGSMTHLPTKHYRQPTKEMHRETNNMALCRSPGPWGLLIKCARPGHRQRSGRCPRRHF